MPYKTARTLIKNIIGDRNTEIFDVSAGCALETTSSINMRNISRLNLYNIELTPTKHCIKNAL